MKKRDTASGRGMAGKHNRRDGPKTLTSTPAMNVALDRKKQQTAKSFVEAARMLAKAEMTDAIGEAAGRPRKRRRNGMYDPGARPATDDPIGAIIFGGQNPQSVLAKVRGEASFGVTRLKVADRPIDYLRYRTEKTKQISDEQFAAAEAYLIDNIALGITGSNTGATIDHMISNEKLRYTPQDREAMDRGEMMRPMGGFAGKIDDPSDRMLATANRLRAVHRKLRQWERAVLDDLLVRQYPVGVIAQRWGVNTEAARVVVRIVLWTLVRVYEETSAEFAAMAAQRRMMEADQ